MFVVEERAGLARVRMARRVLGRSSMEVSAYRLGDLLVDTGPPSTAPALAAWCGRAGVRRVVLTHHHEDHCGGAAALAAAGLPVAASAEAVPLLAAGLRMPPYRRLIWGVPRSVRAVPLPAVVEGEGYRLRVVPTPGHAFTHVCLFDEVRRWLFSGDLFVHERVRYLRRIEDVGLHLASLRRVAALEPDLLLCAHAGPVADARGALARKIAWWEELGRRARELADAGYPPRAVSRRLLGREGLLTYLSVGDFSHANLVRSFLARPGGPPCQAGGPVSRSRA